MANFSATKRSQSQKRVMDLLGLEPTDYYATAVRRLEKAGKHGNGLGWLSWREGQKLSDKKLLEVLTRHK